MDRTPRTTWPLLAAGGLWLAALCGCASPMLKPANLTPLAANTNCDTPPVVAASPLDPPGWFEHAGLTVKPDVITAPVDSEVVLIGQVCGKNGRIILDEKIEWTLDPGGVGHFVGLETRPLWKWVLGPTRWPRKLTEGYAVGMTSDREQLISRGTPVPEDDIYLRRGQTWVTLTSPVEGTSFVTLYCPSVYGWHEHRKKATVHWIDAEWGFPPAACLSSGQQYALTTTVLRHSNRCPVCGWLVRYTIAGGAPAGFASDGAQSVEVCTDEQGRATAQIMQTQACGGVTNVFIEIVRPAELSPDGHAKQIATGCTPLTWVASDMTLAVSAPGQAGVGSVIPYRIDIVNRADAATRQATVSCPILAGLSHVSSDPPAMINGGVAVWNLGDLTAGDSRTLTLHLRADQPGSFNTCAQLNSADGVSAQDCAQTVVQPGLPGQQATLEVRVVPPTGPVPLNQSVTFPIQVTNRGGAPIENIKLSISFPPGLMHASGQGALEKALAYPLAPLQSNESVGITFTTAQPGQHCVKVTATAPGMAPAVSEACVSVLGAGGPGGAVPGGAAPQGRLILKTSAPPAVNVNQQVEFIIEMINAGSTELRGLQLTVDCDPELELKEASTGHEPGTAAGRLVWRNLGTLQKGGSLVPIRVRCLAKGPPGEACLRVSAVTVDGQTFPAETTCVKVVGASAPPGGNRFDPRTPSGPAPLNPDPAAPGVGPGAQSPLRISARLLPTSAAVVNNTVTYEVTLENVSNQPLLAVSLSALLPNTMAIDRVGTHSRPLQPQFTGNSVQFAPLAQLDPGKTRVYRIAALLRKAGPGQMVQFQAAAQGMAPVGTSVQTSVAAQ